MLIWLETRAGAGVADEEEGEDAAAVDFFFFFLGFLFFPSPLPMNKAVG